MADANRPVRHFAIIGIMPVTPDSTTLQLRGAFEAAWKADSDYLFAEDPTNAAKFEHIEQDPYSSLTQQAAALILRDLYGPSRTLHYPAWSKILDRINGVQFTGNHYVVHETGHVLGVIAVRKSAIKKIKIVELVTSRYARHRGYGRLLVGNIASQALKAGRDMIYLNAVHSAKPFYRRLGFDYAHPYNTSILEAEPGTLALACNSDII